MDREQKAKSIGNSKRELLAELLSQRSLLVRDYWPRFKAYRFDFDRQRLIGDGFALQWKTRKQPDQPESYSNQQTSRGVVTLERLA